MTSHANVETGVGSLDVDLKAVISRTPRLGPCRDRWQRIWWRDAWTIAKHLRWGLISQSQSEGAVADFERRFAKLTACEFALVMNSGTATLHSALFAVGVGPGDEVILPSYTWHATASAVLCCGAKPVFCDINPMTLTADPKDIEEKISERTKAIMVVHVFGNPAELDVIGTIAKQHGIALVEDCSHAHGATYKGVPVGSWGDVGCFSCQGSKAVSAGEGGIAVCHSREYYARMLALGHPLRAGQELGKDDFGLGNIHLGPKYRAHLFGVLLALSDLGRLAKLNALRRRNWQIFCDELAGCRGLTPAETLPGAQRGAFLEFKIMLDLDELRSTRDEFLHAASLCGVPASRDRYGFLHEIPFFRRGGPINLDLLYSNPSTLAPASHLPNTERLRDRIITLPAFADVPEDFVRKCAITLRSLADETASVRSSLQDRQVVVSHSR